MPEFTMIYPVHVMSAWPQVEPLLQPAVDRAGTHRMEDVRASLLNGSTHLWVQWEGRPAIIDAAVVTEIVTYPLGTWVRVWLGGASKEANAKWQEIANEIKNFAKRNKCQGIETVSREGWHRLFPDAKKQSTIFRIAV